MSLAITFGAYAFGAVLGLLVHRGGPRLRRGWPVYLRIQLVATAGLLGLFSAWRLTAPRQIVAPIVMAVAGGALLLLSFLVRGARSTGLSQLEGWTAFPNSTFWVLPIGGALVGSVGQRASPPSPTRPTPSPPRSASTCYAGMHPFPQRHSTSWLDQSMLVAVAVGPAPPPERAGAGGVALGTGGGRSPAGLRGGRPLHRLGLPSPQLVGGPHQGRGSSVAPLHRASGWSILGGVALVTGSTAVAVIAVLSAFGPPAFNPPQQAVLYGYRSGLVMIAARWGWLFLPVGLALALVIR